MRDNERKRVTGVEPAHPAWEAGTLNPAGKAACKASVAKPRNIRLLSFPLLRSYCACCGIEIDETDGMVAARKLDAPLVPLCVKCLVLIPPDELPLVHPDHVNSLPVTWLVAVAAVALLLCWLAVLAIGGGR